MKAIKSKTSDFYCTECGQLGIPISRPGNKFREAGHLKKLYCVHCKKDTNHCEIRPVGHYTLENFREEFELGRFVNGKRFPITSLLSCSKIDCPYNRDGKCWNSNYSYDCPHRPPKEENIEEE